MAMGEAFPSVLAAAKTGEEWAWAQIFRDLAGPVTGYMTTRGGVEPEDLVSETFLHVARGIHGFTGDESAFRSWVFVIAHRRLQDERRAATSRPRTVDLDPDDTPVPTADALVAVDAESQMLADHAVDDVVALLSPLTLDQRDVIMLRVVGDLSVAATATALGKSVGSVKSLQRRALQTLHEHIRLRP
jgi:RNA polymerase sigma-70 factor (ECF subfamily)